MESRVYQTNDRGDADSHNKGKLQLIYHIWYEKLLFLVFHCVRDVNFDWVYVLYVADLVKVRKLQNPIDGVTVSVKRRKVKVNAGTSTVIVFARGQVTESRIRLKDQERRCL